MVNQAVGAPHQRCITNASADKHSSSRVNQQLSHVLALNACMAVLACAMWHNSIPMLTDGGPDFSLQGSAFISNPKPLNPKPLDAKFASAHKHTWPASHLWPWDRHASVAAPCGGDLSPQRWGCSTHQGCRHWLLHVPSF